jgi:hypothetical protein
LYYHFDIVGIDREQGVFLQVSVQPVVQLEEWMVEEFLEEGILPTKGHLKGKGHLMYVLSPL